MPLITDATFYAHQQAQMDRTRERLLKSQNEAISRRRVQLTCDDPPAAAWSMEAQSDLHRLRRDTLGVTQLRAEYRDLEQALDEALSLVDRARAQVVRARNSGLNGRDQQLVASEVGALSAQLQTTLNTYGRGHYLFAGSLDNLPPFDATGAYTGNAVVRQVEVEQGLRLPMNLPGDQVFNVVGGQNAMAVLNGAATDVAARDWAAMGTDIDLLDRVHEQISVQRTRQGVLWNRLDAADRRRDLAEQRLEAGISALVEVDEVRASTQLRRDQLDLERGMQAMARTLAVLEAGAR